MKHMKRYRILDEVRGFTLIGMVLYHMIWDLVYIFGFDMVWYRTGVAYVWQQSICWSFILLSGFCFPLGRRKWRRGAVVFVAGLLVTGVSCIAVPEDRVVFGVLTLLGSCMLLAAFAEPFLRKIKPSAGLAINGFLFVLCRNINDGFFGFEALRLFPVPGGLYRNLFTTYLGFPHPGFFSTDYFSLIPWVFLFLSGFYLNGWMTEKRWMKRLEKGRVGWAGWIGRHSLWIYLLHQPLLMLILSLLLS